MQLVAMDECLTGHVASVENPAGLATKLIPGGQKRDYLLRGYCLTSVIIEVVMKGFPPAPLRSV